MKRAVPEVRGKFRWLLCAALAIACPLLCGLGSLAHGEETRGKRSKISLETLEGLINRAGTSVTHGSVELAEGDVIEGHVVVLEGDLEMQSGSSIEGDAIVVSGDALLNGECVIKGELRVVSGFLYASERAEIVGEVWLHEGNYTLEDLDEATGRVKLKKVKDVNRHRLSASFGLGPFNRVDGHSVDLTAEYRRPEGVPGSSLKGTVRIPTENNKDLLQLALEFQMPLLEDERLTLDVEGYERTATADDWRTGDLENSLIAFATSNDDRDYYQETGASIGLKYELADELSVGGGISSARHVSLDTRSPFTLVQRSDDFRPNPKMAEGRLTEFTLWLSYDTRFDAYFPSDAWFAEGGLRSGLDFLGGESTFTIVEASVRRHQRLTQSDFLDLRLKAAGASDALPDERTFSLGSFGGVRGKDFHSWDVPRGDRLLLANVEYRRRLAPVRVVESVFSSWWLVAFYDAGALFSSDQNPKDFGTLFSDAGDHSGSGTGLGVSGSSLLPYLAMFVAKDLDTDTWRFMVRINRPF